MPAVVAGSMDKVDLQGVTHKLGEEAAALVQKCGSGRALTQEDIEKLNASIEKKVDSTFDEMKEKTKQTFKVKRTDSRQEILSKVSIMSQFLSYLDSVFHWVIQKVRSILKNLSDGVQWCVRETMEFFQGLWSRLRA